jgi:predicted nucleotidyltransferase
MFAFDNQDQVLEACRDFGIRKLEVFGSSVRSPEAARDVDLLVDFGDQPVKGFSAVFFGFKEKLEGVLGKPVDLITSESLGNPYFRQSVESTKQLVYEG